MNISINPKATKIEVKYLNLENQSSKVRKYVLGLVEYFGIYWKNDFLEV